MTKSMKKKHHTHLFGYVMDKCGQSKMMISALLQCKLEPQLT